MWICSHMPLSCPPCFGVLAVACVHEQQTGKAWYKAVSASCSDRHSEYAATCWLGTFCRTTRQWPNQMGFSWPPCSHSGVFDHSYSPWPPGGKVMLTGLLVLQALEKPDVLFDASLQPILLLLQLWNCFHCNGPRAGEYILNDMLSYAMMGCRYFCSSVSLPTMQTPTMVRVSASACQAMHIYLESPQNGPGC